MACNMGSISARFIVSIILIIVTTITLTSAVSPPLLLSLSQLLFPALLVYR